jgi:hypothetical protein
MYYGWAGAGALGGKIEGEEGKVVGCWLLVVRLRTGLFVSFFHYSGGHRPA